MFKLKSEVTSIWVLKNPTKEARLILENGKPAPKQFRISFDEVRYCTTKDAPKHYIRVITLCGNSYYKLSTLDTIASSCSIMMHVKRDTIVNVNTINKRHDWLFIWSDEIYFKVSPVYRKTLLARLDTDYI